MGKVVSITPFDPLRLHAPRRDVPEFDELEFDELVRDVPVMLNVEDALFSPR